MTRVAPPLLASVVESARQGGAAIRAFAANGKAAITALAVLASAACASCDEDARDACVSAQEQHIYGGLPVTSAADMLKAQLGRVGALENEYGSVYCTGTLISRHLVLSAAHCAAVDGLYFRFSAAERSAPRLQLGKAHAHQTADLALLEVVDGQAPGVAPVALRIPSTVDGLQVGDPLTLAGVGTTEAGGVGELEFIAEPVVAIDPASISVDGRGRTGACAGDSGGPLIQHAGTPEAVIVGVLSAGSNSCRGIDVHTRLDPYAGWIEQAEELAVDRSSRRCAED